VRRCLVDVSTGASRAVTGASGAVLLVSSDLDELMQVSDRILVLFRGTVVADIPRAGFDAYEIGRLMTGASSASVAR